MRRGKIERAVNKKMPATLSWTTLVTNMFQVDVLQKQGKKAY